MKKLEGTKNYHIAVKERGEDIIRRALNSECGGELCQKQTGELSLSTKEVRKEQEGDRESLCHELLDKYDGDLVKARMEEWVSETGC